MRDKRDGKKKGVSGSQEGEEAPGVERILWSLFPSLVWWVSSLCERDGQTPRVRGTLSIFAQDSGVKVCVRDKGGRRVAFVWGVGLEAALLKAEAALAAGALDWRPDRYAAD